MNDICDNCLFMGIPYNPIIPKFSLPPVKIMFIGENPSWDLNLNEPLDSKSISGKALYDHYLKPLELTRNDVWITNLIKCRYPLAEPDIHPYKSDDEEEIQETADRCCTIWLIEEIKCAKPKVIVTLSDKEVYQRFRKIFDLKIPANFKDKAIGRRHDIIIEGSSYILFPMIHPDISKPPDVGDKRKMKAREKWSRAHMEKHLPALAELLS
jgi:uracil-DNA glycosylase family 4